MSTYCISDLHGCYAEFTALLAQIHFDPKQDTLYVLGDAIDRGEQPIDCLKHIMNADGMHLLLGNHEDMMLACFNEGGEERWLRNGCQSTMRQFVAQSDAARDAILCYLLNLPYYKTVRLGDRQFFLSHAGLNPAFPIERQSKRALVWSREDFFTFPALEGYICIFGHTPTVSLNASSAPKNKQGKAYTDCSVWLDWVHKDKINIDCGCVYGGALAALRLDDGAIFYEKACADRGHTYGRFDYKPGPIPADFFT